MERSFSAPTEAPPAELFRVVADLATYPSWLELVDDVRPAGPPPGTAAGAGPGSDESNEPNEPAWEVTLRARLGPLARSKRLRMVRTVADGQRVRFERREIDGRDHSSWVLSAEVTPHREAPWRSEVTIDLDYGGSLWSGLLEGALEAAADDATQRLQSYVTTEA